MTRRRPSGFFIEQLGAQASGPSIANRFISARLQTPETMERVRQAFHASGPVLHVCLERVLEPRVATALHRALQSATFVRHHHAPYPLWIAPRPEQRPSTLTEFADWLRTPSAGEFHRQLVGWPRPLIGKQVQVARMAKGDSFPSHIDTSEEGVAVVYNFSGGWQKRFGGELVFADEVSGAPVIEVPPLFNSLMVFRSRRAPHHVTPLTPGAKQWQRYTVTAFMLER